MIKHYNFNGTEKVRLLVRKNNSIKKIDVSLKDYEECLQPCLKTVRELMIWRRMLVGKEVPVKIILTCLLDNLQPIYACSNCIGFNVDHTCIPPKLYNNHLGDVGTI